MILKSLGFWGVCAVAFIAFGLIYQLVAGKWLRIRHHWLPLFWIVSWFNSRRERNAGFHSIVSGVVTIIFWTPVLLHIILRMVGSSSPIAHEFGIWKVVGGSFAVWLPFLAHKSASNLTVLSFLVWWFWFHCICTLLVYFSFPRVELVNGLKIGPDSVGQLVSKVRWRDIKFADPGQPYGIYRFAHAHGWTKNALINFIVPAGRPNISARHTLPIGVFNGKQVEINTMQESMYLFVGQTGSGKTTAITGFCASRARVYPNTLFVFNDIMKNGTQFSMFECDPALVYSKDRPSSMRLAEWQERLPRLPNISVISRKEVFVNFVNLLEIEIKKRTLLLKKKHFGLQKLYELEDYRKVKIPKWDRFNPPNVPSIFVIVDDWAAMRNSLCDTEEMENATRKLLDLVGYARFVDVHIGYGTQKATVDKYFPGDSRNQLFVMAFAGIRESEAEYLLSQKINIPNVIGVSGYIGSGVSVRVGIQCTPHIEPLEAAQVFTEASKRLGATGWGLENIEWMKNFRAFYEGDGTFEAMEYVSDGQKRLFDKQLLS